MEYRVRHADGGYRWMLSRGIVVTGRRGPSAADSRIGAGHHASENNDSLTGLANRMAFLDRLAAGRQRRRQRGGSQPVVLFVDIDHFRLIDESLGRAASDEVLVQLTGRLRTLARWSERDGQTPPADRGAHRESTNSRCCSAVAQSSRRPRCWPSAFLT